MADEFDDWDQYLATPVTVTCPVTGEGIPEGEVKITNVEEDIQGFDVVTFECPLCEKGRTHKSYRRG